MLEPYISIRGARVNNLKNVTLDIPRGQLVVLTGVSGSGKSSLAFDTLFAEGQRRYVESLSAYARQFLGRIRKPEVDAISGIPPAIAIEQKVNVRNPRSTLGTTTELYDYLRLFFARIGRTYSPVSGLEVTRDHPDDVVDYVFSLPAGSYAYIMAPFGWETADMAGLGSRTELLMRLQEEGYSRCWDEGRVLRLETIFSDMSAYVSHPLRLLIDRPEVEDTPDVRARVLDSVQTAFSVGNGQLQVNERSFSTRFEADGIRFEEPTEYLFSFNSPMGACPHCGGYGNVTGIAEELVVPHPELSVYEDAVACWKGEVMSRYKQMLVLASEGLDFPIHKPYEQLTPAQKELLWNEKQAFVGIHAFFEMLEKEKYKIQNRVLMSRYTGKTICPACRGARLRPEALYVKVGGSTINNLLELSVADLWDFMDHLVLDAREAAIAGRLFTEIRQRLRYLLDLGLGYLTLDRKSNTLSGGESQRVNLVRSLGSSLVGALYILDEPSIGLHPRDTRRLIDTLKALRDLGNTVLVVEHDEDIIRAADQIIDIGPLAGPHGGEVCFQGPPPQAGASVPFCQSKTLAFLSHADTIPMPQQRRPWRSHIELKGVTEHNLKNIDVKFPLQAFVAVTGVSGSGKSSLVRDVLYPALYLALNQYGDKPGRFSSLEGDVSRLYAVEMIDQNPIGKSSRSNPVTYIKAYDEIRRLFSEQPYAKANGYGHSHFSFNIDGGRCPECLGEGVIKVEMQFMADVVLPCEACGGKRFLPDILEVRYKEKSISDVLDMTVEEAIAFFGAQKDPMAARIVDKLMPLERVGLSYVKLGQNSATLSGGESQRVKLASFLGQKEEVRPRMFIFDEPTTGLHYYDIQRLVQSFQALIAMGHSVVVVEHNMEVVKCADWIIDLGPDAGKHGGALCFAGTPEDMVRNADTPTSRALAEKMQNI